MSDLAQQAWDVLDEEAELKKEDPFGADGESWDAMYDKLRDVVVALAATRK